MQSFCLRCLVSVLLFASGFYPLRAAAKTPNVLPSSTESPSASGVRWKTLLSESLLFLGVEQGFRLATEDSTRDNLPGPFFHDWGKAVGNLHGWADGDDFLINYVGHPMQGAVTGFIWVQNDPKYQRTEFGENRAYWKSRLRAAAFAWAYSEEFEIGPISE